MSLPIYSLDVFRSTIRRKARDEGSDFWTSNTPLDEEINNGIQEIVLLTGCLRKKSTTSTVTAQDYVSLPTDFLTMFEMYVDSTRYEVFKEREDFDRQPTTCGLIWGDKIYLKPTPTAAGTGNVEFWHSYIPTAMSDAATTCPLPVVYQLAVVPFVLAQYFSEFGNTALADKWQGIFESSVGLRKIKAEAKARPEYIMSARFAPQSQEDTEDW